MNRQPITPRGMPTIAARTAAPAPPARARQLPLEPLPDAPIVAWGRRFGIVARIVTIWLVGGFALGLVAQLARWVLL